MNKVTVNVISNTDCNTAYSEVGYSVTNNMICAGVTEGRHSKHSYLVLVAVVSILVFPLFNRSVK